MLTIYDSIHSSTVSGASSAPKSSASAAQTQLSDALGSLTTPHINAATAAHLLATDVGLVNSQLISDVLLVCCTWADSCHHFFLFLVVWRYDFIGAMRISTSFLVWTSILVSLNTIIYSLRRLNSVCYVFGLILVFWSKIGNRGTNPQFTKFLASHWIGNREGNCKTLPQPQFGSPAYEVSATSNV
jgi:hypothetical protein